MEDINRPVDATTSRLPKFLMVLFSTPSPELLEIIQHLIFPEKLKEKSMVYLPSDGSDSASIAKYSPIWIAYAKAHGAKFQLIDNSKRGQETQREINKLDKANILVITGGNTFKLMKHLRESGLDMAIKKFYKRGGIIAAFSAGAIVLSPSLETATLADNEQVGLTDLTGLGLVDFLVLPHADDKQEQIGKLKSEGKNFRTINNNEYIVV